jgi:O-antigen/teichoic acid export membrane protein
MNQSTAFAETSPLDPDALLRWAQTELSMKARVGHVALLLTSLLFSVGLASLWWTEPALPMRTHLAFGAMTLIALAWTVFALRVLAGPRVMFVHHRIVAGRMAVVFTALFVVGAVLVGLTTANPAAYLAAALGLVLVAVAGLLLLRARRTLAKLHQRRRTLELELQERA